MRLSVWKRTVDVSYNLPLLDLRLEPHIENIYPRLSSEDVPGQIDLDFYDLTFPASFEDDIPGQLENQFTIGIGRNSELGGRQRFEMDHASAIQEIMITQFAGSIDSELQDPKGILARHNLYILPWLLQDQTVFGGGTATISVALCTTVYRIQIAAHFFYIFIVFTVLNLTWCLYRVIRVMWSPSPIGSRFPEIDVSRLLLEVMEGKRLDALAGSSTKGKNRVSEIEDVRMYLRKKISTREGEVEMA
jgi:hypothetical protein